MPMPTLKHFDPVLGIDIHIVLIPSPAGPIPTPIPHPYVGMIFDPMDYLPMVGATIKVNNLPRAVAGTSAQASGRSVRLSRRGDAVHDGALC